MSAKEYLYLAYCADIPALKIGRSWAPEKRVKQFDGCWVLHDYHAIGAVTEASLHQSLQSFRHPDLVGREWYIDCAAVRAAFYKSNRPAPVPVRAVSAAPIEDRLAALLSRPGATKLFVAQVAGVHRNTLDSYEDAAWNPRKSTLDKIIAAVESLERLGK